MLLRGDAAKEPPQRLPEVPRHPVRRLQGQLSGMALQLGQILE